jgi:N-acetylmuramoyl-L-alanine amidase
VRGTWTILAALLLPLPAGSLPGQGTPAAWRVVNDQGTVSVAEVRHGTFDALPVATLVSVGAQVSYGRGEVDAQLGGATLRFRVGSDRFTLGDSTFRMEGEVYEERGAVFLPVGFFRDYLPRASASRVSVDGPARVIRGSVPLPARERPRTEGGVFESVTWVAPDTVAEKVAAIDTASRPDPLATLIRTAAGPADTSAEASPSTSTSPLPPQTIRAGSVETASGGQAVDPSVETGPVVSADGAADGDSLASAGQDAEWRGGKRLVVVDAGHGGVDPGARGPGGTREKDVTLAVARRLAALLRRDTTLEVRMTRDRDTLIALRDRTRFANRWRRSGQPAVFISVHCNANPSRAARGIETYFLSEAKTEDARRVEAMENAAERYEQGGGAPAGNGLGFILHDLRQNQYLRESSDWAEMIDGRLVDVAGPSRGVRQAGFAVLNGAFMPAVLVEIGFLTNPLEEQRLSSADHQDDVATQLAVAVRAFLDRSGRGATVTARR